MKTIANRTHKPGKRIHTLKEILERQEKAAKDLTPELEVSDEAKEEISLPNLFEMKKIYSVQILMKQVT